MTRNKTPKVLMLGTGFHRQLGRSVDSPLVCWRHLLMGAANGLRLSRWRPTSECHALAWEELILALGSRQRHKRRSAAELEADLRMAVAQVLHDRVREPRLQDDALGDGSPLAAIHRLMRAGPLHIIDFNHDSTLLAMLGVSPQSEIKRIPIKVERIGSRGAAVVRTDDLVSLYRRFPVGGDLRTWIWKPHGVCSEPNSIRMGLRDYGLQPVLVKYAFENYKCAERTWVQGARNVRQRISSAVLRLDQTSGAAKLEDTWVTRLLAFPCTMIGLSLSPAEWGLYWLFAQRARNYLRRGKAPQAQLVAAGGNELPAGVEQCSFKSWNAAWEHLGR